MTEPRTLSAEEAGPYRYGVFLRPSPAMTKAALAAYDIVTRQFGLAAAAAYPPHVTLVGSIGLAGTESELMEAVEKALAEREAPVLHNSGLNAEIGHAIGYALHELPGGELNPTLPDLYESLRTRTEPVRGFVPSDRQAQRRLENESAEFYRAHLTVAGHDSADNPGLVPEIRAFLQASPDVAGPTSFVASTVSLYRFASNDWPARYWESMSWTLVESWQLPAS